MPLDDDVLRLRDEREAIAEREAQRGSPAAYDALGLSALGWLLVLAVVVACGVAVWAWRMLG